MWNATKAIAPSPPRMMAIASGVAVVGAAAVYGSTEAEFEDSNRDGTFSTRNNPIDVHMMEKLAEKAYLRSTNSDDRPKGVPSTLRLLTIDLPEMRREAVRGNCRVVSNRIYPNGIAPSQQVLKKASKDSEKSSHPKSVAMEIEQKAWVHSMIQCLEQDAKTQRVGVEMLEASFVNMNPNNLRKTRQLGTYHYDPGKHATDQTIRIGNEDNRDDSGQLVEAKTDESQRSRLDDNDDKSNTGQTAVAAEPADSVEEDDEIDAPWNQYAYVEEMNLRILGHIPFGAPLEPSSYWTRSFSGTVYKSTTKSQQSIWEWCLPSFLRNNPNGSDGNGDNWASNKPHAVIANGAALQRVRGSDRLLQHLCRKAEIPLFVVHDPRRWGRSTHPDLKGALSELRKVVKNNVVSHAMQQQPGFARGRLWGRLQRQAEEMVERRAEERKQRQRLLRERRWEKLSVAALEKKLVDHGLIRKETSGGVTKRYYTPAMRQISQQCAADEDARTSGHDEKHESMTVTIGNQSDQESLSEP